MGVKFYKTTILKWNQNKHKIRIKEIIQIKVIIPIKIKIIAIELGDHLEGKLLQKRAHK